jgi:hypothetical protein
MAVALREVGETVFSAGQVPPDDDTPKSLSVHAHGTGLNLQPHCESLVLSWPSSGKTDEQLCGRTHRYGQTADEVLIELYNHTVEAKGAIASSIQDAQYIQSTTGSPQKLIYGTWL